MKRVVPAAIAVLSISWMAFLLWGPFERYGGDIGNMAVWLGSALAITAALAAALVPAARAKTHAIIAGGLMLTLGSFALTRAIGRWPFQWDAMPDARYAGMIAALAIGIGIGLCAGAFWARWAAMAFAVGSLIGGGLNSLNWIGHRSETGWLAAVGVVGGAVLLAELMRGEVAAYFARNSRHALWTSTDRVVRVTRWAAITNFAAAPMLVLYALGQPMAPATINFALVLAPILGLGSVLVVMRRTAGIAILALGGIALAVHTSATAHYAITGGLVVVGYYATFWLPAALLGITAGALAYARARRA
jgi:hypothetical protein